MTAPAAGPDAMPTLSHSRSPRSLWYWPAMSLRRWDSSRKVSAAFCRRCGVVGVVSKGDAALGHATMYHSPTCWYLNMPRLSTAPSKAEKTRSRMSNSPCVDVTWSSDCGSREQNMMVHSGISRPSISLSADARKLRICIRCTTLLGMRVYRMFFPCSAANWVDLAMANCSRESCSRAAQRCALRRPARIKSPRSKKASLLSGSSPALNRLIARTADEQNEQSNAVGRLLRKIRGSMAWRNRRLVVLAERR
mmetsp:Transcript_58569/g.154752  ORF Transcript_58569/g.154752 Transcript_58569/m.154752 type:complete len:251 (-) Transcript_58569:628-1380(-)